MVRVGLIGCGYWGPNILRNLASMEGCSVAAVSDLRKGRLDFVRERYPGVRTTGSAEEVLGDPSIDAVMVASPPETHFALVAEALRKGKHVFVEKPLATSSGEARRLVEMAGERSLTLMVGHLFVYNPAVEVMRAALLNGSIGDVYYMTSTRMNLRPPHGRLNVIWDLACHDVSMALYLLDARPLSVRALARDYSGMGLEDEAVIEVCLSSGANVRIQVGWHMPGKIRQTFVMGSRGAIEYNDTLEDGRVKIYGEGVDTRIGASDLDSSKLVYGSGRVEAPCIPGREALRAECEHFVDCVREGITPRSPGVQGYSVVSVLEAACASAKRDGAEVELPGAPERRALR